jgi:hypothetical protein
MPLSTPVTISAPPSEGWSSINSYDGSGNFEYLGFARSKQSILYQFPGVTVSKANPAVITSVAHGMLAGSAVKISGATAGCVTIIGVWAITIIDADTFSIPLDSSGFAGTFDGIVTTFAPRTNALCWSIQKNFYDGSSRAIRSAYANDPTNTGGTPAPIFAWDSRTTYTYS